MHELIELNERRYRKPELPVVVICVDGFDPAYVERGIADGILPTIAGFASRGWLGTADAVMPTFINPNNVSIVTGAPPAVHGIAGNYYLDRDTGEEVMITDDRLMRCETILGLMSQSGVKTAAITAKDKLRRMLGHGLEGICFSSECADAEIEGMVGRARPDMYSGDLSLFVLDAGLRLLASGAAQLLYLSLSDYVQHGHAPGDPEADAFHRALDARIARFLEIRRDRGAHRRSWHERQAARYLSPGRVDQPVWRRCSAGYLSDHRSVCSPSRGARLVCARLCAEQP